MTEHGTWRFQCPRGHVRLRRLTDGRYVCRSCAAAGTDPYYDRSELVDTARRVASRRPDDSP